MKAALAIAPACLALLLVPGTALAHSFGRLYNLPVPFWMYLYGAAAALAISFLIVAYFVSDQTAGLEPRTRDVGDAAWVRALRRIRALSALKLISVCGLLLCMATGFFGTENSYTNFNMTFFWVVFVLGFTYLTATVGDLYALINPWKVVIDSLERVSKRNFEGRFQYPVWLGYYPAFAFYMLFIWIELFATAKPYPLAVILSAYSLLNILGVWLIGKGDWFSRCEFFGVFFRLISRAAPLEILPASAPGEHARLRLRWPFVGLAGARAENLSLLLFVLFMLSSTTFDALRETRVWIEFFWKTLVPLASPYLPTEIAQSYTSLRTIYVVYQSLALVLSPFLYLAMVLACMALAKAVTRSVLPVRALALRFAFSLLPIALVYHVTHYYTLVLSQGLQVPRLISDPFGLGWNVFGTAGWLATPLIPDAGWVWHTQVGLILLGHIVSVYLAHVEALRTFPTRREATLSQMPMLVLMLAFTTIGLWILSQPLGSGTSTL